MIRRTFLFLLIINIALSADNPYVILISFDGFRWDYSNRNITPNLDSLKSRGVHALSLKPSFPTKTFPNHYSIVTGMYPENHGIIFNSFVNPITNKRYRLGDTVSVRESRWYLGESFWETAERNGIITASFFWPGSEINLDYRRPTYFKNYVHTMPYKERIDGVIEWLSLPVEKRPHFISIYFHDTDSYGHDYGPNSLQIDESIKRLDSLIAYLDVQLRSIGLYDSTNIIIVSDHGMTEVDINRTINIEKMLSDFRVDLDGSKPVMMVRTEPEDFADVFQVLKNNEFHYSAYTKDNLPEYYHFKNNPFIYPIILVAEIEWSLVTDGWYEQMKKYGSRGNHGYDNNHTDMHGIFIAAGPNFKRNFAVGTLNNVDIYPLLCKIFDIKHRSNIDGKLERIEYLLK